MTGIRRGAWVALIAVVWVLGCSSSGDDDSANPPPTVVAGGGGGLPMGSSGNVSVPPGGGAAAVGGGVMASGSGAPLPAGSGGMGPAGMGGMTAGMGSAATGGSVAVPPTPANSWTMMGGDARNTYYNASEKTLSVANAAQIEELWVFPTSSYPYGSPLIVDGKVYATAMGGTYAIDLKTGMQVWLREDLKSNSSLAYEDGFLYLHASDATLHKLNAVDGKSVWGPLKTYDVLGADGTSSPIVGGGKVIVGHSTTNEIAGGDASQSRGGVFAADAATGMMAWHIWTTGGPTTPENGAMVWSSVTIHEGVVYIGTGNNYTVAGPNSDAIQALDLATGMRKWSKQVRMGDTWILLGAGGGTDTDFGANPIIADVGGKKIVAAGDKGSAFWALDRDTGNVLWSRPDLSATHFAAHGGVLNNGAFDGQFFYVISNDPTAAGGAKSVLHKLDPADGKDVWPAKVFNKITWGMPSLANGLLVVPVDTELVILNAETGDELKRFDTGGTIAAGAAAIADGKIVVKSGLDYPLSIYATVTPNNEIHCYGLK
jgi:polyvinyl alcohol dehydrogenase (cytochrome)